MGIALLAILIVAVAAAFNTALLEKQRQLEEAWIDKDEALAVAYWTRIKSLPPPFVYPIEQFWISSGVGYRTDPMGGGMEALHKGIDMPAPVGTPVDTARSGKVAAHWPPPGTPVPGKPGKFYQGHPVYGGLIVIDNGNYFTIFGHLSSSKVHEGQFVEAGQKIGEVGATGICTGPHLHFEIVVDPLMFLQGTL